MSLVSKTVGLAIIAIIPLITCKNVINHYSLSSTPEYRQWKMDQTNIYIDSLNDIEMERRRMQFGPFPTPPPTDPPTLPPTPDANTLNYDNTSPFILVNFEDFISWGSANTYCKNQVGSQYGLGFIDYTDNTQSYQQITDLCQQTTSTSCWFGLRYNNVTSWEWNNGVLHTEQQDSNWISSIPSIDFISNICAFADYQNNYKWQNSICFNNDPTFNIKAALCQNPYYGVTTKNPSPDPTMSPTTKQPTTRSPTTKPTTNPTPSPTNNPTPAPSNNPTPSPSDDPTPSPTDNPTPAPTNNPTPSPSSNPTPSPTDNPTPAPSDNPTPSSTDDPTPSPTDDPTPSPTTNPTPSPTDLTPDPTLSPTTREPTTRSPTTNPTPSPTDLTPDPTMSPTTKQPTTRSPTANPTPSPTSITGNPTRSPTTREPTTRSPTTKAPTAATRPPRYVGCFIDSGSPRDLSYKLPDYTYGSVDLCVSKCKELNYIFAGLQFSKQCFCGNSFGIHGDDGSGCSMPCYQDSSQICGNSWRNSIYITGYIGCFVDGPSPRDLTVKLADKSYATVELCSNQCKALNYRFAGLQYSKECFCDNSYGTYGQDTSTNACNMPCHGDSNQICGDSWRNSIYCTDLDISHCRDTIISSAKSITTTITWSTYALILIIVLIAINIICFVLYFYQKISRKSAKYKIVSMESTDVDTTDN